MFLIANILIKKDFDMKNIVINIMTLLFSICIFVAPSNGQTPVNTPQQNVTAQPDAEEIYKIMLYGTANDVKKLLNSKIDVNGNYACSSLLGLAIQSVIKNENIPITENKKKIQMVIDAGANADLEVCKSTPLTIAVTLPYQKQELMKDEILFLVYHTPENITAHLTGNCDEKGNLCFKNPNDAHRYFETMYSQHFDDVQQLLTPHVIEIVDILLKNGADINKIYQGLAPLHLVMLNPQSGGTKLLQYLIDKRADINIKADDGSTPLFIANYANNKEAVKLLLSVGADPNIKNNDGQLYYQYTDHKE